MKYTNIILCCQGKNWPFYKPVLYWRKRSPVIRSYRPLLESSAALSFLEFLAAWIVYQVEGQF